MKNLQFSLEIDLTEAKIQFIKDVTGIDDIQEATEHFTSACVMNLVDPNDLLNKVEENNG